MSLQRVPLSIFWAAGLMAVAVLIGAANYYVLVVLRDQIIAKEEHHLRDLVASTAASVGNVICR